MKYLLIVMIAISFLHAGFWEDLGIKKGDNIEKAKKKYPYFNEIKVEGLDNSLFIKNVMVNKIELESLSIEYSKTLITKITIFTKENNNKIFLLLYNDTMKAFGKPAFTYDNQIRWVTKKFHLYISSSPENKRILIWME